MGTLRKYRYFVLLIVVPVLLLFISNSVINRHSHLVRGYVFYHAHPFNKEQGNNQNPLHSHTDAELIILDLISDIDMLVFFILATILFFIEFSLSLPGFFQDIQSGSVIPSYSPRGPPVYSSKPA
ncbi:MAG: hypothetical protein JW965_06720 [Bacteroidales bacterium]|nr:hypothetical protein [Bacteroidales bacterium]